MPDTTFPDRVRKLPPGYRCNCCVGLNETGAVSCGKPAVVEYIDEDWLGTDSIRSRHCIECYEILRDWEDAQS